MGSLTRDDAENSEDFCEGSDVEIAATAAVSFSVDVYDNNDDGDDDDDDDGRVKRWDDDDGVGGLCGQLGAPRSSSDLAGAAA